MLTLPTLILLVLALIWLVLSVLRREFSGSGFWFQAVIVVAVLLTFGVGR